MLKNKLSGQVTQIILVGVGLASLSSLVYVAGPYVNIGGWRPLDNYIIREILVVLLITVAAGFTGFKFWRRRKSAEALADGIAGSAQEDDSEVLGDRMKDALLTLKKSGGNKADFLYDLPWYIIIGPPGSGKTTALVNSGLRFPLSGGAKPAAIAGIGGTRYCDWWFTEDAVLIDTAGRYTTQDSDASADRKSWLSFLDLLKKNRPRQPINGVMLAISIEDVLKLDAEALAAHSKAIRARLLELHELLKVDFPVYAIFTKADLVAGFVEFFANLNEGDRRQVWGATFQTADKTKNFVSHTPEEFDALIERLNAAMPDRLQEEAAPSSRVALFGFPAQMTALRRPLYDFLNAIFEPTRYHAKANLRGFYFTSGTQQGTPIDQLINALVKNFGAQDVGAGAYSGQGKSYFIHDLIQKLVIGEAAWVSTDLGAVRRAFILKAAGFAAILAVCVGLAGAWATSWQRNNALISNVSTNAQEYSGNKVAQQLATTSVVGDHDFNKVLPLLQKLRYAPTGYAERDQSAPMAEGFGLSQRDRLESVSETAYRTALERLLRPRLLYRLEALLNEKRSDPAFLYEALKVYLMLGGQAPTDRDLVLSWERQDFAERLYPGAALAGGRQQLEDHVVAMLDLANGRDPIVDVSGPLIEDTRRALARVSLKERAYGLLKSDARALIAKSKDIRDWSATTAGGADFATVFEATPPATLDQLKIPGFFTYAGFQRAFLDQLPSVAERISKERWVLGSLADQGTVSDQYQTLTKDLLDLYTREYIAEWMGVLKKIQLKNLTADKPRYVALTAAAGANSPLISLFESVRDETALTKERPGFKKDASPEKQQQNGLVASDFGEVPGARVEEAFRPYHRWVEKAGSRRQIDELVAQLSDIRDNLINSTLPSQAQQSNANLQAQILRYRASANQLPDPVKDTLMRAASSFETDVNSSEIGLIQRAFAEQIPGRCQIVNNRYPFTKSASAEVPLQDFGNLFKPGGLFDTFFQTSLKKYVDTSNPKNWTWRADQPVARRLSLETLRQFQRAEEIKNVFFASGGAQPSLEMSVATPVLAAGASARLELNGQVVTVQPSPAPAPPQALRWPGVASAGRAAVTLMSDQFGGPAGSTIEKTGAWSFFKLLDAGSPAVSGDRLTATYVLGGRELQFTFAMGAAQNPYNMPALREFRCPASI